MKKEKVSALFDGFFTLLILLLVVGVPLLFTSYTRSVFEVNKMLILRLVCIVTYVAWLFKYILFKDNGYDNAPENSVSIWGFRWKLIGLEVPMLVWVVLNILSTVFSQNIKLCIIGAYDRWEGIVTVLNYILLWLMLAKLVRRRIQLQWVIGGIIAPAAFSAIYGVFQSFGKDFMNWSVNPTARVFACINNPVHFCAYMGMVVPLAIGWLLFISTRFPGLNPFGPGKKMVLFKWILCLGTALVYYGQVLSFSRATWLGFVWAMPLFYLAILNNFDRKSSTRFVIDFFATLVALGIYSVIFIFQIYVKSVGLALGLGVILLLYLVFSFFSVRTSDKTFLKIVSDLVVRVFVLLIFGRLQFVAISISSIGIYIALLILFYFSLKKSKEVIYETKFWLVSFVAIFGFILIAPTLPYHASSLFKAPSGIRAGGAIEGKINTYKDSANKGTARTSMWKSSFPWIKDYWLLGSGPDTIKYMYPVYRRTEYGILEGGHNFTPDRLHNEYLNTFATRGIPATLVFYLGVVLGWYFIVLRAYYSLNKNPYGFIMLGFMAGATVYLGQVLFNFGVVATLVLFYLFTGLSHAIAVHSDFRADTVEDINEKKD